MEKAKKTDWSHDFQKITNMLEFIEGFKEEFKNGKLQENVFSLIDLSKKQTDDWSIKYINECIRKINSLSEEVYNLHNRMLYIKSSIDKEFKYAK